MKKNILLLLLSLLTLTACETKEVQPAQEPAQSPNSKIDYEKINQVIANSTMLMKQIPDLRSDADSYCSKSFRKLEYKDPDYANFERINIGYIRTPEAQAELQKILGDKNTTDAFAKDVEKFYIANEAAIHDWTGICKKNKEVYAFFQPVEDPSVIMNIWRNGSGFSEYFHDESMNPKYFVSDGAATTFLIDAQGENSLVYKSIKDLPIIHWTIESMDPEKLSVTQIEDCKLTFEYTQKPFWVNADKYTFTCDKQYKP